MKLELLTEMKVADAIYGFAAWLTTRKKPITFGSGHNCAPAADAVKQFLEKQGEEEVSDEYPNNIIMPEDYINSDVILEHKFKDIRYILMNQDKFGLVDRYGNQLFPSDVDDQFLTSLVAELNIKYKGEFKEASNLNQLADFMRDMRKFHKSGPAGKGHSPGRLERGGYERRHPISAY